MHISEWEGRVQHSSTNKSHTKAKLSVKYNLSYVQGLLAAHFTVLHAHCLAHALILT